MEAHIKLAAKLYNCRDTAKKLYGQEFHSKIYSYKGFIKACMLKHNYKDEITAALHLANDCKKMDGGGIATMLLMAACVEMIEPECTPKSSP